MTDPLAFVAACWLMSGLTLGAFVLHGVLRYRRAK